jgi:hypothetical protein
VPNSSRHRSLIALNMVLLGLLALVTLAPGAGAQPGGAGGAGNTPGQRPRAHGQYGVVGGRYQGGVEAAMYIVDSANEELLALRWDRSRKALSALGYRDMAQDRMLRERGGR